MNLTLPVRPDLDQLKHQAKDCLTAHARGDADACSMLRRLRRFAQCSDAEILAQPLALHEAQYALALTYGFSSWDALRRAILATGQEKKPTARMERTGNRVIIREVPMLTWGKCGDCTWAGALESALAVSDHPLAYHEIMGLTGLAFRVRWYSPADAPGAVCPSSPVGEFPTEIEVFSRLSGLDWASVSRMENENEPQMETCCAALLESLDQGRPVIGYPQIGNFNVGVAFGYERADDTTAVLWTDYLSPETRRVPLDQLGPWYQTLSGYHEPPSLAETLIECLGGAWWRTGAGRTDAAPSHYRYGPAALDRWSEMLANAEDLDEEQRQKLFFVSWWCFSCLSDARRSAVRFLNEKVHLTAGEVRASLQRATALYGELSAQLDSVYERKDAFLGPWSGWSYTDWTPAMRERERQWLKTVRDFDTQAITELDQVVEALENKR